MQSMLKYVSLFAAVSCAAATAGHWNNEALWALGAHKHWNTTWGSIQKVTDGSTSWQGDLADFIDAGYPDGDCIMYPDAVLAEKHALDLPFFIDVGQLFVSDEPEDKGYSGFRKGSSPTLLIEEASQMLGKEVTMPCGDSRICTEISDASSLVTRPNATGHVWSSLLGDSILFSDLNKAMFAETSVPELGLEGTILEDSPHFDTFQAAMLGDVSNYGGGGISLRTDSMQITTLAVGLVVENLNKYSSKDHTFVPNVRIYVAKVSTVPDASLNRESLGPFDDLTSASRASIDKSTGACTPAATRALERISEAEFNQIGFTVSNLEASYSFQIVKDDHDMIQYLTLKGRAFTYAPSTEFMPFQVQKFPLQFHTVGTTTRTTIFCLDYNYIGFSTQMPSWTRVVGDELLVAQATAVGNGQAYGGGKVLLDAKLTIRYFPRFAIYGPNAPQLSFDAVEATQPDTDYNVVRRGILVGRGVTFTITLFPDHAHGYLTLVPYFAMTIVVLVSWWKSYDAITSKDGLQVIIVFSGAVALTEKISAPNSGSAAFLGSGFSLAAEAGLANLLIIVPQLVGFMGTSWMLEKAKYKMHARFFFDSARLLGLCMPLYYFAALTATTDRETGNQDSCNYMWIVMTFVILFAWILLTFGVRYQVDKNRKAKLQEVEDTKQKRRRCLQDSATREDCPSSTWTSEEVALWIEWSEPMQALAILNDQERTETADLFRDAKVDGMLFPLTVDPGFLSKEVKLSYAVSFYVSAVISAAILTEGETSIDDMLKSRYDSRIRKHVSTTHTKMAEAMKKASSLTSINVASAGASSAEIELTDVKVVTKVNGAARVNGDVVGV